MKRKFREGGSVFYYKILSTETGDPLHNFTASGDSEAEMVFRRFVEKAESRSGENLKGEYVLKEAISEDEERTVVGYSRGGRTTGRDIHLDKKYHALPSGKRMSNKFAEVQMSNGTSYIRQNGNQFYNKKGFYIDANGKKRKTIGTSTGGSVYYEYADNRTDKKTWV